MEEILIIDDDIIVIKLIKSMLKKNNFNVIHAQTAKLGLSLYYKFKPKIVLVDYNLPDKDGIEILKEIKKDSDFVEVIIITGDDSSETFVKAIREGAFYFIKKQDQFNMLNIIIQKVIEKQSMQKRLDIYLLNLEKNIEEKDLEILLRKKAEDKSRVQQQQLFLSSKLASIGELAAGIAHEISNPLSIVFANMDDLKDELIEGNSGVDIKFCNEKIKKLENAVKRITRIVKGIKRYAYDEKCSFKSINVYYSIEDTISIFEPIYAKKNISIVRDYHDREVLVKGNPNEFSQVIMNLLSNAKDAMDEKADRKIIIKTEKKGNNVLITVSDTGYGIDENKIDRIYDAFYTTKPPGKGTGLGLSITYSIIKNMNGRLTVDSMIGKGTIFTVEIPTTHHLSELKIVNSNAGIVKIRGRALLVDDEDDYREVLKSHLIEFGLDVDTSNDGIIALEKLKINNYDYLITDLMMPGMNGEDLIEEGTKSGILSNTRVIIITGGALLDFTSKQKDIIKNRVHKFLEKPFNKHSIYNALVVS